MALATVTVRTTALPDLAADLDSSEPGVGSWFMKLLKPSFQVQTPLGSYTRAPWGDPGESAFPVVAALVVLGVGLAVVYLARRLK